MNNTEGRPYKNAKRKNTIEGHLYKRAKGKEFPPNSKVKGRFWIRYSIGGEPQKHPLRTEHGDPIFSRAIAEQAMQRLLAPLNAGTKVDQLKTIKALIGDAEQEAEREAERASTDRIELSKAWKRYLESPNRPDSSEGRLSEYKAQFDLFTAWMKKAQAGVTYLDEVTPKIAEAYARNLNREGYAPSTYNKHIQNLKRTFKTLSNTDPFKKIPARKNRPQSRRELTIEELKTILESTTGEMQTLFYVGTFTGLRLKDCALLQWGEVDLHRGIIQRVPSKTKNSKPAPVVIGIPAALHEHLTALENRKGYVMPELAGMHDRDRAAVSKHIQSVFKAVGIKTEGDVKTKRNSCTVGFHSLRHTYVSLHASAGTSQSIVQKSVGHSSPAMTAHYTHVDAATAIKAAAGLPSIVGDVQPIREPVPVWVLEKLEGMTSKNWKQVRKDIQTV